jgi:hypothetical protein
MSERVCVCVCVCVSFFCSAGEKKPTSRVCAVDTHRGHCVKKLHEVQRRARIIDRGSAVVHGPCARVSCWHLRFSDE